MKSKRKTCYWSEQHQKLLERAAQDALKTLPSPNIEIEDLISVGWISCLRRRSEKTLRGCYRYTYLNMIRYLFSENCKAWKAAGSTKSKSMLYEPIKEVSDNMDYEVYLESIPEEKRKLVVDYGLGSTFTEIANRTGISREAVRAKYARIIEKVRERFRIDKGD